MPDIILSNLPAATTPLSGTERVPMDQRVGNPLAATALTPGLGYVIVSVGSTNWTVCGVPAGVTPVVGLVFTCLALGTGTGTAQQVETVDAAASDLAALAPPTNLSYDPSTRLLTSSTGEDVTLPLVTTQAPGLVPTLAGGAGTFLRSDGTWATPPGGATDLSYDPATRLLASSTGTDVTLPLAGATTAGLLPPTNDPLSLTDLTVTGTLTAAHIHGAMAGPLYIHVRNDSGTTLAAGVPIHVVNNQGDTDRMLVVRARADDPSTLPANGIMLAALAPNGDGHAVVMGELTGQNTAGLTSGAQVYVGLTGGLTLTRPAMNPQAIATVGRVHASTGSLMVNASPVLGTAAFSAATDFATATALSSGLAGKADLVNGQVPSIQLPGFVDDVLEFANIASFPATGETGKLYISLATNRQYRWSGSIYVEINPSPGSTDGVPEGSVNLYFTDARGQVSAANWWTASASKTKLDGIASGATANSTDAQLRDRTTHTGEQSITTITGLQSAIAAKADRFAPVITLTAVSGVFTVDVPNTSAARIELGTIAGNVTILLANGATPITSTTVADIPAGTAWSAEFGFTYTSGTITWVSGSNTGISRLLQTLDFGASGGPTLTAGKSYTVLMSHTRGSTSVLWWVVGAQP